MRFEPFKHLFSCRVEIHADPGKYSTDKDPILEKKTDYFTFFSFYYLLEEKSSIINRIRIEANENNSIFLSAALSLSWQQSRENPV